MNKYYVSIDVGLHVTANSKEEAESKVYDAIGNADIDVDWVDDYTIIGEPKLLDTEIENVCFTCNKRDVGGSNDKQCPKCFAQWEKGYKERHPNE